MNAYQLEALMVKVYGPDFRNKTIVGPFGSFRLADAFAECGLQDPKVRLPNEYGLWQMMTPRPLC